MFKKKKTFPQVDKRKGAERRKPGDQRFDGRLVGKKKGKPRAGDRRKGDRRKSRS